MGWVGNPRQWNCYIIRIHPHDVTRRRRGWRDSINNQRELWSVRESIVREARLACQTLTAVAGATNCPVCHTYSCPGFLFGTLILAPILVFWDTYSGPNFHLGHLLLPRFTFGTLILAPCFSVVVVAMRICIGHTLRLLFFPEWPGFHFPFPM